VLVTTRAAAFKTRLNLSVTTLCM